jgi:hypothetical protein
MPVMRPRPTLWLLAAACLLAMASPSSSENSTLAGEDIAMLDALAALLFNLEDGRRTLPLADPAKREIVDNAILYDYIEPSVFYGSTEDEYKKWADSKYVWNHFEFRSTSPCIIWVEGTIKYSQQDSKELFDQNVVKHIITLDLSGHRLFEFLMITSVTGVTAMKGDDIWCNGEGKANCVDEYDHPLVVPGALTVPKAEWELFEERRLKAAEDVRKRCPPQPG